MRAFALALVLVLANVQIAQSAPAARVPATETRIDGAHPGKAFDMWRMSGHLFAADGAGYDYVVLVFRYSLPAGAHGAWSTRDVYSQSTSIVDENTRRAYRVTEVTRPTAGVAGSTLDGLAIHVRGMHLRANAAATAFALATKAPGARLELRGTTRSPRVLFGRNGFVGTPDCACEVEESAYTRIASTATLRLAGRALALHGSSWLDHSYGDRMLKRTWVGWQRAWFWMFDGREFVLDRVRDREDRDVDVVTEFISADDRQTQPASSDFSFAHFFAMPNWHSPASDAVYPDIFAMSMPKQQWILALEPVMLDQEIVDPNRAATFWEGAIDVYDVRPGTHGKRLGVGFIELTGYAQPIGM